MDNPFDSDHSRQNYSEFIRNQVKALPVGESVFVESLGAPSNKFTSTLSKVIPDAKFATRSPLESSKVGKGFWVKRTK